MSHSGIGRLLAGFSVVFLATSLFAESQARIVRLSDVQGGVQIDRRTGDGFESALENLPITQGTRLETKDDGRAEIEFEDGSTLRLTPNTSIEFTRLSLHDSGGRNTEVEVSDGTAYFNIDLGKSDDFVVDLGSRSVNLQRSARFRATVDRTQVDVAVSRGEIELVTPGSEPAVISKNRTATFDLSGSGEVSEARGYEDSEYEDWNAGLDDYHTKNFARGGAGDSPYAYGFSDLNYYGSYLNDPGSGSCWRPYFASFGWDPFADGSWVWYPGFGYTWVSSYPWGWAPYRYGSWNYLPTNGWCWQPGAFNQWVAAPRLRQTPPGFKPILPPANGHGRIARIHGATVTADSRFGDPDRRRLREGLDGQLLPRNFGTREAGLGVPRGRVNLSRLPAPPSSESHSFTNGRVERGPAPRGTSSPSYSPPSRPPAPRIAAPPPPPSSPPRSASPAPRGGRGN